MSTTHEVYRVTVTPGARPEYAAARLARYIVQRWMPGNAGGVHVMVTPRMAEVLLPFFQRPKPTVLSIDTMGITPCIAEVP